MYLVEEFLSAQLEGRRFGELSIFIRLFGCNRTCEDLKIPYKINGSSIIKYGCDSYYAVDKEFSKNYKQIYLNDLIAILDKYSCKNVVITGGEPLINIKDIDFLNFIDFLNDNNYKVTIETNGDIDIPKTLINKFKYAIFSISPKDIIKPKDYWFLNKDSYIKAIFKHNKLHTNYLLELKNLEIDVYIMPNGDKAKILELQRNDVLDYCINNGFNYTTREHVYIFGGDGSEKKILFSKENNKLV